MSTDEYSAEAAEKEGTCRKLSPEEALRWVAEMLVAGFRGNVTAPDSAAHIVALWIIHTHTLEYAQMSPRLIFWSNTPGSGKTQACKFIASLARDGYLTSKISPKWIPRFFDKHKRRPRALVLDEFDEYSGAERKEVIAAFKYGWERDDATISTLIQEGGDWVPKEINAWGPICIGTKGQKPDAASLERSIVFEMEPDPSRLAKPYDKANTGARCLHDWLAQWAKESPEVLTRAFSTEPHFPPGFDGRERSKWRHLLQIAEFLGGAWPEAARQRAQLLAEAQTSIDPNIVLLAMAQRYFEVNATDRASRSQLWQFLNKQDGVPWASWNNGKGIRQGEMRDILAGFKQEDGKPIKPHNIKMQGTQSRGYYREDFARAFALWAGKIARLR